MTLARIRYTDPGGRFASGEIGEVMENDYSEKYAYKLRLRGVESTEIPWDEKTQGSFGPRVYYFFEQEVSLFPTKGDRVTVPKGTVIWGTFPEGIKEAGRTYTVEVFDTGTYPEPHVTWVGASGYWHNARLEDLEQA